MSVGVKIVVMLLCVAARSQDSAAPPMENAIWRDATHANANGVYLMLRSHGIQEEYARVVERLGADSERRSLQDLILICREGGLACEALAASPLSMAELPLPAIVHIDPLDADYSAGGRFALLSRYLAEERVVVLYDGATAIRSVVSKEDFHELWSGVVIVATYSGLEHWVLSAASAVGLLAAVICSLGVVSKWWR